MGFVEDDRIFSTLMFMKTRLQNKLSEHLDLVVRMFAQPFYTVDTFPYDDAIMILIDGKKKRVFWLDVLWKTTLVFHDVDSLHPR
jgi:hypothetical protein